MKTSAIKYLVGIVLCEIILLFFWVNIAPDADVSKFESVKKVLNSTNQPPEFQLASSAIQHSSQSLSLISIVILLTSSIVIILAFLVGFQVLKNQGKKL